MGYYSVGKFNLVVSFRYAAAGGEMGFWCQLLEQVSRILNDATDGKHSIGHVLMSQDSMGGQDADIWVHQSDPDPDPGRRTPSPSPNANLARLWYARPAALDIWQDSTYYATALAHELAHYLYDLGDEYYIAGDGRTILGCQDNLATEASLMEAYDWNLFTRWAPNSTPLSYYPNWPTFYPDFLAGQAVLQLGQPTEFCWSGNHDTVSPTPQNNRRAGGRNKLSCWVYMADDSTHNNLPYGLAAPPTGPTLAAPVPPPAVTCTELIPVQRFILVLDRSGSMYGGKLDQLKIGADFWIDYVNADEELGLVSYATAANLDSALSPVPSTGPAMTAWRAARHTIADNVTAGGLTAIGDALRLGARDMLTGGRASSQVMILFTDGMQNAGNEIAEEVLPDLIASGVRCYTIGLGNDQGAALLSNIATTTGARYFAIDGDLDPDEAAAAITEALIEIAGESRENGGIVSFQDVNGLSIGFS